MGLLRLHKNFILREEDIAMAMFIWLMKECKAEIIEASSIHDMLGNTRTYYIEGHDIPQWNQQFCVSWDTLAPNVLIFQIGKFKAII